MKEYFTLHNLQNSSVAIRCSWVPNIGYPTFLRGCSLTCLQGTHAVQRQPNGYFFYLKHLDRYGQARAHLHMYRQADRYMQTHKHIHPPQICMYVCMYVICIQHSCCFFFYFFFLFHRHKSFIDWFTWEKNWTRTHVLGW